MNHTSEPSSDFPWPAVVRKAVHDMRTPVSSILTVTAILRQLHGEAPPAEIERVLALLERQAEALSGQLQRLADSPGSFIEPQA